MKKIYEGTYQVINLTIGKENLLIPFFVKDDGNDDGTENQAYTGMFGKAGFSKKNNKVANFCKTVNRMCK